MLENLNFDANCSAFSPVNPEKDSRQSFITIRNLDTVVRAKHSSRSSDHHLDDHHEQEDSESTHHSNHESKACQKMSKEEKRTKNLKSINKLISSRRSDTLNELEKIGDDESVVLKSSPKPPTRNSKLSHFRGVSHNGRKWQVMIMGFAKKIYFGGINTEEEASHIYDKYAVLMHGLEVSDLIKLTYIG
jgi:hypothetical protein